MPDTTTFMRQKLKSCSIQALFIEELGWNHHRAAPLVVENDGVDYVLNAVAEKHGMVAYECQPGPKGQMPDYPTRGRVERQVAKSAHEHVVVFVNQDRTMQTWQWVRREKGKPTARREHTYVCAQPGDSLIQKLQNLMVSLEEEEKLTIVDVAGKVRQAFDVDRVTKRFYDRFKDEHKAFLSFIEGISAAANREWYASLMLNRLMFIYFIQKKGFLDGDTEYLRNRLQMVRQSQGKGKFHTFYRYFLRRLFHEGLAQRREDRKAELNTLLGSVPYLNGGLFDTHQLENDNPEIHIPDEAFERLFAFFDAYRWHLDERPTRRDDEINPDVLGYIFEKYINQKQMGAYYTKEDITEYISKSTIVPFVLDAAEKKWATAFLPNGEVWRLLPEDPDRYIYDAVKRGVDLPLPQGIAAGVVDAAERGGWNQPADEDYALPTETWREHVARRTRYVEFRAKLATGEIQSINDLLTYNLDLRQFAQDVVENCERPELLRAIYQSISEISVLDPTCGSGAFLFAALNILEPLYEACLDRMEAFVQELDKAGEKHHPEKFSDFRKVLDQANDRTKHPSRRYFVLKSVVLSNLYGVDIMAEAVEICKLRLFLKLVAQVERVEDVEPLPDIDFNIRAGNTLVGFASLDAVRKAMTMGPRGQRRMLSPEDQATLKRIDESAELADRALRRFREQQTVCGMQASRYAATKIDLHKRLASLRTELDRYLATEYGIDPSEQDGLARWHASHQPFHWFVEFYGVMRRGGFSVIIGNPPYVEYSKIRGVYTVRDYRTLKCGNLYAFVVERSLDILQSTGRFGLILQMSSISTDRMEPLQGILLERNDRIWCSAYAERPSKLFEGVETQLAIVISHKANTTERTVHSTRYNKWEVVARPTLFHSLAYVDVSDFLRAGSIPKLGSDAEKRIILKIMKAKRSLGSLVRQSGNYAVSYRNAGGRYYKIVLNSEPVFKVNGRAIASSTYCKLAFPTSTERDVTCAIMNSGLFYWYWVVFSDNWHMIGREIDSFPVTSIDERTEGEIVRLCTRLIDSFERHAVSRREYRNRGKDVVEFQQFVARHSKGIIDDIDDVLATCYGLSEDEKDFIINYDIKYRMGKDSDAEQD